MRIDQTNYLGAVDQAKALLKQRQIEFDGAETLRTQGYRAEAELAAAEAALATANANLIRAKREFRVVHLGVRHARNKQHRSHDESDREGGDQVDQYRQ